MPMISRAPNFARLRDEFEALEGFSICPQANSGSLLKATVMRGVFRVEYDGFFAEHDVLVGDVALQVNVDA
jgi:hypothetical protein